MKNPFRFLKKLNPIRPVQKGVSAVKEKMVSQIVLLVLRHGLTAFGLTGVLSNDELSQLVGALATAVGLLWSAWRKIQRARNGTIDA